MRTESRQQEISSSDAGCSGTRVVDEEDGENLKDSSSDTAENSPSASTINLRKEYKQIWSSLTHHPHGQAEAILRPDRASVDEAIRSSRPTRLTAAVSRYLESSEQAFHLLLSLRRSADLALEFYTPLLALPLCGSTFDAFIDFDRQENPFNCAGDGFGDIRKSFSVLKLQLELRLLTARRRHGLLRKATIASATCLMVSVTGAVAAALVLASHVLVVVAAVAPAALCCGGSDVLAGRRRRLKEGMAGTDAGGEVAGDGGER